MILKFKLFLLLVLHCASSAHAETDPDIIVLGERRESRDQRRGGTSRIIRPQDETRFDANAHLKMDPSLTSIDRPSLAAGGFSLPLFRGHDVRSTFVLLNGVVLQDPFTGFPLVEDIDLRSFGELRIHKGIAPWDVPVAAPGGVLQFLSRKVGLDERFKTGGAYGDVQGASVWSQGLYGSEQTDVRVYARRHTSKGDYELYDDHQTIRNSEDDFLRRRTNNEANSTLASTHGTRGFSNSKLTWFGWNQNFEAGQPVRGIEDDGHARIGGRTTLAHFGFDQNLTPDWNLGLAASGLETMRSFNDPDLNVGRSTKRELLARTSRGTVRILGGTERISILAETSRSQLRVNQSTVLMDDYSPSGDELSSYVGTQIVIMPSFILELKADHQWQDEGSHHGNVGAILFSKWSAFDVWGQLANHQRSASLLERLGNSAEILPSIDLNAERGVFAELGVRHLSNWNQWKGERSAVVWSDVIQDRIRTEPVSVTLWRSRNVDMERYSGLELREHWILNAVDLEGAFSVMRATQENGKMLPRVPLWQGVGGVGFLFLPEWTARLVSRYRGRVFDDYENTSEIGELWLHDISLDRYSKDSPFALGFSVLNFTDVKSLPVRDVETRQSDGRIAFESQDRQPLPGRQWVLRASAKF